MEQEQLDAFGRVISSNPSSSTVISQSGGNPSHSRSRSPSPPNNNNTTNTNNNNTNKSKRNSSRRAKTHSTSRSRSRSPSSSSSSSNSDDANYRRKRHSSDKEINRRKRSRSPKPYRENNNNNSSSNNNTGNNFRDRGNNNNRYNRAGRGGFNNNNGYNPNKQIMFNTRSSFPNNPGQIVALPPITLNLRVQPSNNVPDLEIPESFRDWSAKHINDFASTHLESEYENYKKSFINKVHKQFYDQHKNEIWFSERYSLERLREKRINRINSYQTVAQQFMEDAKLGHIPHLNQNVASENKTTETDQKEENKSETTMIDDDNTSLEFHDNCVIFNSIPGRISHTTIDSMVNAQVGFRRMYYNEPSAKWNYSCLAFAVFDTQENCRLAVEKLNLTMLDNFELRLRANNRPVTHHTAHNITLQPDRIQKDIILAGQLIDKVNSERQISPVSTQLMENPLVANNPLKQLNLLIEYLRVVHHYCYYCYKQYADYDELFLECGLVHQRNTSTVDSVDSTESNTFITNLETAIQTRLNMNVEEAIKLIDTEPSIYSTNPARTRAFESFVAAAMTVNGIGSPQPRYKCKICTKIFLGVDFIKKHMENKHGPEVKKVLDSVDGEWIYELYLADNHKPRILPSNQMQQHNNNNNNNFGNNFNNNFPNNFPNNFNNSFNNNFNNNFNSNNFRHNNNNNFNNNNNNNRFNNNLPQPPIILPPPTGPSDPRAISSYADLDAPKEEVTAFAQSGQGLLTKPLNINYGKLLGTTKGAWKPKAKTTTAPATADNNINNSANTNTIATSSSTDAALSEVSIPEANKDSSTS